LITKRQVDEDDNDDHLRSRFRGEVDDHPATLAKQSLRCSTLCYGFNYERNCDINENLFKLIESLNALR